MPSFISRLYPITNTEILGAKIAWCPLITLFIYTAILKSIDDYILGKKITKIQKVYNQTDKNNQEKNPF
jgi:hypothetical protein